MAKGKKSFVLYADLTHTLKLLSNEDAGLLFKHLLSYVNDENPISDNGMVNLAFEPIKQQLKRDLKKFENTKEDRSINGRMGNLKRYHKDLYLKVVDEKLTLYEAENVAKSRKASPSDKIVANLAVNDNVNVNDNDNDNDNDNVILLEKEIKVFTFKNALLELGVNDKIIGDFLKVRKTKKAVNSETAFNAITNQIALTNKSANEIITICVERSWSGFKAEWIKEDISKQDTRPYLNGGSIPMTSF
tara:strand:- start:1168 stop:1905 length:738 start_codon:yes stop_codon:yes gene_type:complete